MSGRGVPRALLPGGTARSLKRAAASSVETRSDALALPWWCGPAGIAMGFTVPVVLLVALAGAADIPTMTVRGVRFLDTETLALALGLLIVLACGGWLGARIELPGRDITDADSWEVGALVCGTLALAAYVIWFRDFVFNPALLFATLTGAFTPDKSLIELTPGVTSLVNIAPVFFSFYAYRVTVGKGRMRRLTHVLAGALLAFTLFRVYAWTERLALIEAAVPFGLAVGAMLAKLRAHPWPLLRAGGPYLALPLVILFFGASEYFRSWDSDTYRGKSDFWAFAIGRLASYYYTALNNGAGMFATVDHPTWRFEFVLLWLHTLPLPLARDFSALVNSPGYDFPEFLVRYGDVEFNSPTGLFAAIVDLGLPGGMLYLFAIGVVSGLCFTAYRHRRVLGIFGYPIFFISALEILRYPYLGTPRAFTWVVGIVLLWAVARLWILATRQEGAYR